MRRPRAFTWISALSLLLLAGVYALWLPSAGAENPNVRSWTLFGVRYGLRSHHGWLTLLRPPPASPESEAFSRALSPLSNDDLRWTVTGRPTRRVVIRTPQELADDPGFTPTGCTVQIAPPGEAFTASRATDAAAAAPLLDALEDNRRFAVAHVLLTERFAKPPDRSVKRTGDLLHVTWHNLEADLEPVPLPGKPEFPRATGQPARPLVVRADALPPAKAAIDPAQLPRILQQWHDVLDVPVFTIPHAALIGIFVLCPMIWIVQVRRNAKWKSRTPAKAREGQAWDAR